MQSPAVLQGALFANQLNGHQFLLKTFLSAFPLYLCVCLLKCVTESSPCRFGVLPLKFLLYKVCLFCFIYMCFLDLHPLCLHRFSFCSIFYYDAHSFMYCVVFFFSHLHLDPLSVPCVLLATLHHFHTCICFQLLELRQF